MDGNGGCCIARYSGGGAYDLSSKVDRIMLRFRPIAPKPAVAGSGSGSSASGSSSLEMSDVSPKSRRGKRRCNGGSSNGVKRCNGVINRKKKGLNSEEKVVTLALLPETPDRKEAPARESPVGLKSNSTPTWLSFGSSNANDPDQMVSYGCFGDKTVVGSCVTVECVTETLLDDADALGCTDEAKRASLERDTCPGLMSDGIGRVTWANEAYRKMVGQGGDANDQALVWLVMKEAVPVTVTLACHRAFTCRVRVQYGNCYGRKRSSITVPCDVWRMDGGGFAWRLDVKAALCLGR